MQKEKEKSTLILLSWQLGPRYHSGGGGTMAVISQQHLCRDVALGLRWGGLDEGAFP